MLTVVDIQIGRRLRRRRRILGFTQQHVAGALGIRHQQLQKYETGVNRVLAARLWQLACVLEVPVSYFFEGLTDAPPQPEPPDISHPELRSMM